jgi:hypothetical protein
MRVMATIEPTERRRPSIATLRLQPDPRRIREFLAEVESGLGDSCDQQLRRNVRLLVGEIAARLLGACPRAAIQVDLEVKADSVRVDIAERGGEPCDFWDALDDAVFSDLTTAWGRDRRRGGGAWFELEAPSRPSSRDRSAIAGARER